MRATTLVPKASRTYKEQTFDVINLRDDKKDTLAQTIIALQQLIEQKFTGQIIINCVGGGVGTVQTRENA